MRLTDYLIAAGAIVNAARTGTHELTPLAIAHIDELLQEAAVDAIEIETRLREPECRNIVSGLAVFEIAADVSLLLPPDEPPTPESNVIAFPARLTRPPLMLVAKAGQIGPRDGGDAA